MPGVEKDIAKMSQLMSIAKIPTKQIYKNNFPVESFWAEFFELLDSDRITLSTFVIYYSGHGR